MKVKNYYWDYLCSEDYDTNLQGQYTPSEMEYHASNMDIAKPLYKELEYDIEQHIERLRQKYAR